MIYLQQHKTICWYGDKMEIHSENNKIKLSGINDFNPTHTFMCGQCFRWEEEADNSYTGIAFSKVVNIKYDDGTVIIDNVTVDEFNRYWKHYLDFDSDYNLIKQSVCLDENVSKAIDFGWGIKILNQEIFECLISFIISTQNTIPRIQKIVNRLSQMYGKKLEYNGKTYYAFPTLEELSGVDEKQLSELKAGYRAAYIVDAVTKLKNGEVDLSFIKNMSYQDAKKELMKIRGVGPKVADCVLLFSAEKKEAFPIDVWVKRTVQSLYLNDKASVKEIEKFASDYFGSYAGVAQQYLFYYSRENKLGKE